MRKTVGLLALAAVVAIGATAAQAANIGVVPTKYIVVDKQTAASKSKAVFVSKDQAAGITKGPGTDVADISVTFSARYDSETAEYNLPAGASNGTDGWLVNKDTVAKYVNKDAPNGPTSAKVGVIKPGKLLKLVGKDQGDGDILDIFATGAPSGSVFTAYCVTNGGDTNCMCSEFPGCAYKLIAADSGAKLVCKGGVADPGCTAAGPAPTQHVYTFTVGAAGGTCGEARAGGAAGAIQQALTCGGLNIGGGAATVPEGPTPAGSPSNFNAACSSGSCAISARTAIEDGGPNSCTDTGCNFGAFLSIANGGLSTCVHNTFGAPASGSLDLATGAFSGSVPLTSATNVTGNAAEPCPPCTAGLCAGVPAGPNNGGACTALNGSGDNYDCPPGGTALTPFPVILSPIGSGTQVADTGGTGLFCPGQATAGAFGCGVTSPNPACPAGGGLIADYVEARGSSTALVLGGAHSQTLASIFCIPMTGNVLIDGAADLPGPGETTLPGTGSITP